MANIKKLISKGNTYYTEHKIDKALDSYNDAYKAMKKKLDPKVSYLQLGQLFGYELQPGNVLKQIGRIYLQQKQYDKVIEYCNDIIETFNEDKYVDDFHIMLGKALFLKGNNEEANRHYTELLKKYPNNLDLIYEYLLCLKEYDLSASKDIITTYVPLSLEYNVQTEDLFKLCKDMLNDMNETALARQYASANRVQSDFGKKKPVTKKVKVGRNDPCPCGSGKKYKNCCGR